MRDKIYCWLYKRSIKHDTRRELENKLIRLRTAVRSGIYTGRNLHNIKLQMRVLLKKLGTK